VKVFVTGGAGYVGSICVEELLQQGDEVIVFDNLSEGHRSAIDQRATYIQGDLTDLKSITLALDTSAPDAVMHFAASALVGESMANPYKYFQNNVYGGLNLLHAMIENDVKRLAQLLGSRRRYRLTKTRRNRRSIRMANRNYYSRRSCNGSIKSTG
jgi:UDP-glucose 4-epimerase